MSFLNYDIKLPQLIILAFFIILPFEMINHSLVYSLMELFFILSAINYSSQFKKIIKDPFFKGYLLIIMWCLIVTALSPVAKQSFKSTTQWFLPLLMIFPFYTQINLRAILRRYLWLPSLIILFQSIVLFIYFKFGIGVIDNSNYLSFIYYLNWEWTGKVYSSTLSLCLIVLICACEDNKIWRNSLCFINLVSGLLSYDRAFIFSLTILGLIALYLKNKHCISKTIKWIAVFGSIIAIVLLFYIVEHILNIDLHIVQRLAVYTYWLPKLFISPIHGVGVGIPSLQYYLQLYPVPQSLLEVDIGMKTHAHNLLLDIALTQGFVGVLIFVFVLIYLIWNTLQNRVNPLRYTFLYMIVVIFSKFMVDDRFEAHMMIVFWFFLLSAYLLSINKES